MKKEGSVGKFTQSDRKYEKVVQCVCRIDLFTRIRHKVMCVKKTLELAICSILYSNIPWRDTPDPHLRKEFPYRQHKERYLILTRVCVRLQQI